MTDHNLREPRDPGAVLPFVAEHCEAKLHGFRRTQDGVVVSFVLHPQEVPQALALDPLGTRYMLAFAAIGDDEQPVSPASHQPLEGKEVTTGNSPRKDAPKLAGELQRQRYATMSAGERAVTRAALLPRDERFRVWATRQMSEAAFVQQLYMDEQEATHFIRETCCGGNSRKLIAEVPEYLDRFLVMEASYMQDVGLMARPR